MNGYQATQQPDVVLVPQGLIGNIIGALAGVASKAVGGTAGNVIGTAGQFANLLPFSAGPQMSQQGQQGQQEGAVLVPQGLIGSIIGALAPLVGGAVGGTAGNVIGTAGQFANLLPFSAGPQMTPQGQQPAGVLVPQGLIGSIIGALAPLVGGAVGGTAGNVIGTAGQFANLLPFSAGPQMTPQMIWPGNLAAQFPWLVQQAGAAGQQFGNMIPFSAGPQMTPQSIWPGNLAAVQQAQRPWGQSWGVVF